MEESKALHRLVEAQDLVGMIETMLSPEMADKLSPSAWSGLRITLRSVREMIGTSHAAMANDFVSRSKSAFAASSSTQGAAMVERVARQEAFTRSELAKPESPITQANSAAGSTSSAMLSSSPSQMGVASDNIRANPGLSRRDLKASLERLVERS
jgi:hypothetical protein